MEWRQSRIHLIFIICVVVVWLGPSAAYRSRPSATAAATDGTKNKLEVRFQWKQIGFYDFPAATTDFAFRPDEQNVSFVPYNNVPIGITRFRDQLFITVPRRRPGIPSTLNYVNLDGQQPNNQSPLLRSYPDYETNRLDLDAPSPDRIVSVYRPRVDVCNRLWFVDTGMLEYPNNRVQVQRPSIWIVDLQSGRRLQRFEIPVSLVGQGNGLTSITVDVESGRCDEAFAYLPDLANYRLYVFSLAGNRMWTFAHNYFYLDPLYGDFNVAGIQYQWRDGIFSVTLGSQQADGSRLAYFHAMASLNEFTVSTNVLKNETNALRPFHGQDFQLLGRRPEMGQTAIHSFDHTTGVVFAAEVGRNALSCWNSVKPFVPLNHATLLKDDERMIYPADLNVDPDGYIWVISNKMPRFVYSRLDENEFNFRVWMGRTSEIIQGSVCS